MRRTRHPWDDCVLQDDRSSRRRDDPDMTSTKRCPDCGLVRDTAEFGRNAQRPDGLSFYCLTCNRRRAAASYARRRERQGKGYRPRPAHPEGHKQCADCGEVKAVSDFHRSRSQSGGFNCYCKPCRRRRVKDERFLREYGLRPEQLQAMLDAQGGLCALCRERPAEHVDHDHVFGTVRGVLCFPCNAALGQLKDRVDLLTSAIDYLETTTWQRTQVCTGVYRLTSPRPGPRRSASSSA